jgi:hypothetical protein
MIIMTLRHHIGGRDIILEVGKDGGLASGLGRWEELLLGTWRAIVVEERRRERYQGAMDGLGEGAIQGAAGGRQRDLVPARARVQAVLVMKVQGLDLLLEDRY